MALWSSLGDAVSLFQLIKGLGKFVAAQVGFVIDVDTQQQGGMSAAPTGCGGCFGGRGERGDDALGEFEGEGQVLRRCLWLTTGLEELKWSGPARSPRSAGERNGSPQARGRARVSVGCQRHLRSGERGRRLARNESRAYRNRRRRRAQRKCRGCEPRGRLEQTRAMALLVQASVGKAVLRQEEVGGHAGDKDRGGGGVVQG